MQIIEEISALFEMRSFKITRLAIKIPSMPTTLKLGKNIALGNALI